MNWNDLFLKYTAETLEFIKTSKDVAVTQGGLYIEELIKYEIIQGILVGAVFLVISILCAVALIKARNTRDGDIKFFTYMFGSIFLLTSIIMVGCNVDQVLKAYYAPRVFVVEKLSQLVK